MPDDPTTDAARLSDDAYVVRGGTARGAQLHGGCGEHAHAPEVFGFSVQSRDGAGVDELARAGTIPNKKISVSTVGAIRSAGYDVVVTAGRGHHATVVVPRDFTLEQADELAPAFEVQLNPEPRR